MGVHLTRHRGGPGWLTVTPEALTLEGRGRTVVQTARPVTWERKRFEPPWGNCWVQVSDGSTVAHAVVSRRRCARILEAARAAGHEVS